MKKKRHWLQVKGTELAVRKDKANSADQFFLTQTCQNGDQPENYLSKGSQALFCIQIHWRTCINLMPRLYPILIESLCLGVGVGRWTLLKIPQLIPVCSRV